jgi:hypothetical protein
MLMFKAKFLPLIRSGKKRQTIRLWRQPRVRPGQHAYVPGLGRVLITHVQLLKSLRQLTAADARRDGFPSRAALLAEIAALYGPQRTADRCIFRIRFHWPAPPVKPPRAPAAKPRRSAGKPRSTDPDRRERLKHFVLACERVLSAEC